MKHRKITALLCAMALMGTVPSFSAAAANEAPSDPYRTAVQKMKDLEKAEKEKPEDAKESPKTDVPAGEVNYTDALMKGLDLTVADVQSSIEAGTFKNLSPEAPKPVEPEPIVEPEPEPASEAEPEPLPEEPAPEEAAPVKKFIINQGETANTQDTDGAYDNIAYISEKDDENALRIPMAYITSENGKITKSGNTTDVESSRLYGLNAAVLATHGGRVSFTNALISSSGTGSAGAYGYSKSTYINLTGSTVTTEGDHSPGVIVSAKAMMKTVNTQVSTKGNDSPVIEIADGGGILIAEGGSFTASGLRSHGIYSKGDVTVTNSTVKAEKTKAAVLKGNNTITLRNTVLEGNEIYDINPHNIVLFSKDDDIGTMGLQQFDVRGGTLIARKGDMFYVTSTHGRITLAGVTLIKDDPSSNLIIVTGNDGANDWGTPGSNGGHLELICDGQTLDGNIVVDSISNVNITLKNDSTYTGAVTIIPNGEGGASYKTNADVFIAAGSTWNLTGNSTLTSLNNLGTINYNGYTITLADGTVLRG